MNTSRVAVLSLIACIAHSASAGDRYYACSIGGGSLVNAEASLALPLAGTWIGDYDATENPGGTQTQPGVWGGSGNNAIPFTSIVKPNVTANNAVPTGGFGLIVNETLGLLRVEGFSIDLFGTDDASIGVDLTLGFSTFRTFSPNSLYFGVQGLTLPLPIGSVSKIAAEQNGLAGGALLPIDEGYSFVIVVPVSFTLMADALGQSVDQVILGVFAMTGSVDCDGTLVTLTATGSVDETVEIPDVIPEITDAPLGLPTILPPGGTANLLVTGTIAGASASIMVDATLQATGESDPSDLTGDGRVNADDIMQVLRTWGTNDPHVDLSGNGDVGAEDLARVLGSWRP